MPGAVTKLNLCMFILACSVFPSFKTKFLPPFGSSLSQKYGESFGFGYKLHWMNCIGKAWSGLTEPVWLANRWVVVLWELSGFPELPFWERKIVSLEQPYQYHPRLMQSKQQIELTREIARCSSHTEQGGGMWSSNCPSNSIIPNCCVNETAGETTFVFLKEYMGLQESFEGDVLWKIFCSWAEEKASSGLTSCFKLRAVSVVTSFILQFWKHLCENSKSLCCCPNVNHHTWPIFCHPGGLPTGKDRAIPARA